jgi:predicted nucleic acid-binding Zn ribbon protein
MAERLLQHKHCRSCDKAIPAEEKFCNDNCRTTHEMMMRKKKNQLLLIMFIAVVMMVFALLSGAGF